MLSRLAPVGKEHARMRLDLFLARHSASGLEDWTRSGIQRLIADGQVTLNGRKSKPGCRVKLGDVVEIHRLPPRRPKLQPEPILLDVLYEDEDCIVINKRPGMVVHPAAGNPSGTLVNALLHRCPDLQGIGGELRPGIVHRLDKDTSGVMVIAKNERAFQDLSRQFKDRRVGKEYLALVWGKVQPLRGLIRRSIGRHRSDRKKMSSLYSLARRREAETNWSVEASFPLFRGASPSVWITLLRLKPHTGRTHQIRVHLADEGYPVVGDRIYGRKRSDHATNSVSLSEALHFPRQALHAATLGFRHPRTGAAVEFNAPLPPDMKRLLDNLEEQSGDLEGASAPRGACQLI
ncbi:MAG: RluA family pseudouridine synthase [Deltaproteobacteria bacterium]|nr:RluA family pseudouridine synthase [Deltaproteobacteria bacterium]